MMQFKNRFFCGKSIFFYLILMVFGPEAYGQRVYNLRWQTETLLSGFGIASGGFGVVLGRHLSPLTPADILLLNRNQVFRIDRQATYWASKRAEKASDYLFYAATAAPLIMLINQHVRQEVVVVSVLYAEAIALTAGLTQCTKNMVLRSRPYTYNSAFALGKKEATDARKSFFSGHTSSTAVSCFFAAKVWSDFHPESRWRPVVWTAAAAIPAVTGYLRMRAGQHFFTDVAAGYLVGGAVGWLVPALHKKNGLGKKGLSLFGSGENVGLVWQFSGCPQ
jgi:membrane-associated phospholipid phosphatase